MVGRDPSGRSNFLLRGRCRGVDLLSIHGVGLLALTNCERMMMMMMNSMHFHDHALREESGEARPEDVGPKGRGLIQKYAG